VRALQQQLKGSCYEPQLLAALQCLAEVAPDAFLMRREALRAATQLLLSGALQLSHEQRRALPCFWSAVSDSRGGSKQSPAQKASLRKAQRAAHEQGEQFCLQSAVYDLCVCKHAFCFAKCTPSLSTEYPSWPACASACSQGHVAATPASSLATLAPPAWAPQVRAYCRTQQRMAGRMASVPAFDLGFWAASWLVEWLCLCSLRLRSYRFMISLHKMTSLLLS